MKLKLPLIGIFACMLTVFSFAKYEPMQYYMVPSQKVEEYAKRDLFKDSVEVFKILDRYRNYYFDTRPQMSEMLHGELKKFPQYQKLVNNFAQASHLVQEDTIIDKMGFLNTRVWINHKALDTLKWYIKLEMRKGNYSKIANDFLENMQDIVFPDSTLAHNYALSLFAASMGVCNDSVVNLYIKNHDMKWNESQIRELVKLINLSLKKSEKTEFKNKIERKIKIYEKYNGRICSDERWEFELNWLKDFYSQSLARIVDSMMIKENSFDTKASTNLKVKSCGCSHKEELNGEVFGIYPYWYVGDTTKWVDFEGITRLAFYGLHVDDEGNFELPSGAFAKDYLDDKKNYEFVNDVHRHFVKLDWIITKDDWNGFKNKADYKIFFNNLISQIDILLNKKVNSPFQRFVNAFTFYTDEFENRGDGVTIYFKNYPDSTEEYTDMFNSFFRALQDTLAKKNKHVHVNLMMERMDLAGNDRKPHGDTLPYNDNKGIYSYSNLTNIFSFPEHGKKVKREQVLKEVKNHLLVVIEEPVSRSKRLLLSDLNQQLNGVKRRNVLHSLVPVIWFDNLQWKQLRNDALYYNDTYYGLGIAPYATNVQANDYCNISGNLGACMLQNFENEDGSYLRQGAFSAFICTPRWAFRFINFITFLIAIGVLISYFSSCTVADFFNKRLALLLGIVIVPSTVMMTILARLDPSVAAYRSTFGMIPILVLLLTVIAIILIQVYRKNDLPKRRGR